MFVVLLLRGTLVNLTVTGMCAMDYDDRRDPPTGIIVDDVSRCK
jgi:hypothetical protein